MGTKELGRKEVREIQNTGTEDSKGNIIVDKGWGLKTWENYITRLYNQTNRPENLHTVLEEEVGAEEKISYILQNEVEKAIKDMSDRKGTEYGDVLWMY